VQAIETDAVIIGAGPVGLFQAFELGLLEIQAHIIDVLPEAGGQCVALYPNKPIYDIPGIPVCTGRELVNNLLQQITPFKPPMHLGQAVMELRQEDDSRFFIRTTADQSFISKTVFIAAGVGAFQARKLALDGIAAFENKQVFYHVEEPEQFNQRAIVICGGDETAVEWAIHFASTAKHVTLVHRRSELKADKHILDQFHDLRAAGKITFCVGQATGYASRDDQLTALEVEDLDGHNKTIPLDALLVFFGLSPKLGPIAEWGLALSRKQIEVDTAHFESSIPGIFAVGDINTYPGKKKLILSGFHEAALAAFAAAQVIFPDRPVQLQYTTTSPKLQQLLGLRKPA
jgi:thioredoxin reductase (NADPH)